MQQDLHTATDTIVRTAAAAVDGPTLAAHLLQRGWAIDTTPAGTVAAAHGPGRLLYPAGLNGCWDTRIQHRRPAEPASPGGATEVGWQVTVSQAAPVQVLLVLAGLAADEQCPQVLHTILDTIDDDDDDDPSVGGTDIPL